MQIDLSSRIYGCLLGGMIGDAMGAPVEGKTYAQIEAAYGPDGVTDFDGTGTDDTAIREQLIRAIVETDGHVTCDEFAATFLTSWQANYGKWWVPVRNMAHKVQSGVSLPVDAGYGNTASSSSAMAISPMGILNAMNPRQAALETFDVASLIHSGPTGFCRDAACAMAAAVAAAFHPDATVESVQDAAVRYLHQTSAHEMIARITTVRQLAATHADYRSFREAAYASCLYATVCDSRETIPIALALFGMAGGDPRRGISYGVNFGRDADTIGTMVGGLCGAYASVSRLPEEWVAKVEGNAAVQYREIVPKLITIIKGRARNSVGTAAKLFGDLAQLMDGNQA
jgi:ADP-ribosylglycohydrolase